MSTTSSRRRRKSGGILFIVLFCVALLAWGGLALFTRYVPPQTVSALLIFFLLLSIALVGTLSSLIYLVTTWILTARSRYAIPGQALRQGGLISLWILCNLLLRLLHSWSFFTAIVSFGIITVVEILALGHK
jgi:hypothetical protein